ncbi:GntR family transcriptional regulator [Aureimonas fodinaquatilis]|uniref:GntR family transcriptional regulator n=1 Tax=Aureimonas fodinaquatilis TaxID=2565783 RepID=A0A5B0DWI7_9HYPH|nr:GntR family transcriptional regulator [Aureimonas fodinaquatilis]KAA0969569.1 GntR family transcriptional regulator [Aureimonas fodinaquatilis]
MSLIRNKVFEQVRGEILSCSLMPGMELREANLAKRFGVSKSPIRDALQKLEFEGLVEIEPRRGHRVRPISLKDAQDILELRAILDAGAVRLIVEVCTDEELKELDRFREMKSCCSKADFAAYNREFHTYLAKLSKNNRLAEECQRVMEFYDRICIVSLTALTNGVTFGEPLADHCDIIDALQARNASKAARLARKHVEKSRGQVMRALESRAIIA